MTGPVRQRRFDRLPFRAPIKRSVRAIAKLEAAVAVPERALMRRGWLDATDLRLPDFLGIGGVKSATTWLYENLRAHPGVFLPAEKELHYFGLKWFKRLQWYAAHFEHAGDRVAGEITPAYGLLPVDRIRDVAELMPDLRLVLLMRNPVDRAWSHAVMKLSREKRRPMESVPNSEIIGFLKSDACRRAGDYAVMIGNWTTVFPAERLFVAAYEDVSNTPVELLQRVFSHLGVSAPDDYSTFPATTVIDRGAGGSGTIVGKTSRTEVPEQFRPLLEDMYREPLSKLRAIPGLAERVPAITQW